MDSFEIPMIADKTHSKILSLTRSSRCRWYKKITVEEKNEAVTFVEMTYRAKMSGENHHMKRPEARAKFSRRAKKLWETPEHRAKIRASQMGESNSFFGKSHSEETKAKMSASRSGENSSRWKGGISFEPYCLAFNEQLKEKIRNRDNRTCVLCGKGEIQNGRKLDVHHIDGNKIQGCSGTPWYLTVLCLRCHSKVTATRGQKTLKLEFLLATRAEEYQRR